MTVARLQQVYLCTIHMQYWRFLLFTLLKQDGFALYCLLPFPLLCNHAIFDLADCLKNQKPFLRQIATR